MNKYFSTIKKAIVIVFENKKSRYLLFVSFVLLFVFYSFLLPATFTGGIVGLVSLRFLNFELAVFAFLFSVLLSLIIAFFNFSFLENKKSSKKAAGSFFGSVLPPLLCCSPLLPSIAAFLSGAFPYSFLAFGFLQGFLATYETQIYSFLVFLLFLFLYQNAKQVLNAKYKVCQNKT